jgi:hypothetical protein
MSIYTLVFPDDAGEARVYGSEERLEIAAALMAAIGGSDPQALVLLPAGYAVATSEKQADAWAEGLAAASRSASVAVVFGIDVAEHEKWGLEGCPRSLAYASDRGRRLLWGIRPTTRTSSHVDRTVTVDAARVTIVFARELLAGRALALARGARAELAVVLAHGAPTRKWLAPYAALDAVAPALVVHQGFEVRRPAALPPPRGWTATSTRSPICVATYRRQVDGATARVVGH